jgi:sulfur-carrier protein adenylyltransferase/sulfurtransferase
MFESFFKSVPRWTMDRARQHIEAHKLDAYNLIDVRQPEEYAEGHLPGATSIPLGELPGRIDEIDRSKLTLVYCRSGGRAGNGTALLTQSGFEQAHNIGGIMEYNGLVASGAPEAGMAVYDAARKPEEYVALAWAMEEGARLFYHELGARFSELTAMFETMAVGEERHRDQLAELYRELSGQAGEPALEGAAGLMEGGIDREEALAWARQREAADVLEFAATMEANAHDRYIHVGRAVGGTTERAFVDLAEAEKVHMGQLMQAFGQRLG